MLGSDLIKPSIQFFHGFRNAKSQVFIFSKAPGKTYLLVGFVQDSGKNGRVSRSQHVEFLVWRIGFPAPKVSRNRFSDFSVLEIDDKFATTNSPKFEGFVPSKLHKISPQPSVFDVFFLLIQANKASFRPLWQSCSDSTSVRSQECIGHWDSSLAVCYSYAGGTAIDTHSTLYAYGNHSNCNLRHCWTLVANDAMDDDGNPCACNGISDFLYQYVWLAYRPATSTKAFCFYAMQSLSGDVAATLRFGLRLVHLCVF